MRVQLALVALALAIVAPAAAAPTADAASDANLLSDEDALSAAAAASPDTPFPIPYNWAKFPTAWFASNATNWEDEAQLAAIGKYSMAILGWQHLDTPSDWVDVVYLQLTQAGIIKDKHPDMPVFVYCGFGFAFGLNAGTWGPMKSVLENHTTSPYRDFFLESSHGPVFTHTNCQQGHTSTGATDNHCLGYFWNMANASAREYFVENLVAPLATAPMIDGIFYDAFNYGYDIPETTPWGLQTINVPNCSKKGSDPGTGAVGSRTGCDALVEGTIDVAVRTAKLLNEHGKVPMYANPGTFLKPLVGQNIWMNESRLVDALAGTHWMTYYESMRTEAMYNGCPGATKKQGQCDGGCCAQNMLMESKLGVAAGVHTYLHYVNKTDPTSPCKAPVTSGLCGPVEDQTPHIAAFMLARTDNWYYFGSTGWWDDSFTWDPLWDKVSTCGKPLGPAPAFGSGPIFARKYEHCQVHVNCTNTTACTGDIKFGTTKV